MAIKLIVGLANPGAEYAATRHNAGAWYVDLLAERLRAPLREEPKFFGYTSRINLAGADVRLLVPTTFMNLSGKAVAAMATFYRINPDEILVAHDELDLPPGVAKFKLGGGHGGHGLCSQQSEFCLQWRGDDERFLHPHAGGLCRRADFERPA